jgi:hypothetical protein
MPTPSIIDENRRSRPSPGVSGDEESHQLGEVSRTERSEKEGEKKMSRDEKVKEMYGVGVLKKGKGKLTVHSEDLLNSDKL